MFNCLSPQILAVCVLCVFLLSHSNESLGTSQMDTVCHLYYHWHGGLYGGNCHMLHLLLVNLQNTPNIYIYTWKIIICERKNWIALQAHLLQISFTKAFHVTS